MGNQLAVGHIEYLENCLSRRLMQNDGSISSLAFNKGPKRNVVLWLVYYLNVSDVEVRLSTQDGQSSEQSFPLYGAQLRGDETRTSWLDLYIRPHPSCWNTLSVLISLVKVAACLVVLWRIMAWFSANGIETKDLRIQLLGSSSPP
ncbi:hypothetical protein MIR68_001073 [Amoeboaphelidium protococcarum]|nr:hypothetical protein MIR68_001073 [Amoeboaphelidium protococcarum]